MAWCKHCFSEYEDHVEKCAECGEELVDEIVTDVVDSFKGEFQDYVFLMNCKDNHEANVLISILEANGIHAMTSYESSGSYLNLYFGYNYQGVDISVPIDSVDEARNILVNSQIQEKEVDLELEAEESEFIDRRKKIAQLIVWFALFIPLMIVFIYNMIDLLQKD